MCGLSGIIDKTNSDTSALFNKLKGMTNLIAHRGPDQAGYLQYKNLYLSHVRLSVIDPRNLGRQPMSRDDRYSIIFNGEIYNYLDIKNILKRRGYSFFSDTDTEVALVALIEWGIKAFNYFNGDWVICFLDKKEDKIILAKDNLGILPIYIFENSKYFSFCSEIKGFEAIDGLELNDELLGYANLTIQNFNGTKFKNVNQIAPGNYLEINFNNFSLKKKQWFSPLNNLIKIHPSFEVNKRELFDRLNKATELRLDADIKIGTSLSGGLDSSIIFSILNMIENDKGFKKDIDLNPTILDFENNLTTRHAINLSNLYEKKYNIVESNLEYNVESLSNVFSQLEIIEEYNRQIDLYRKQRELGINVSIDGHGADEFLGMLNFMPQFSFSYFNAISDINKINNNFNQTNNIELMEKFFGSASKIENNANLDINNIINFSNFFGEYINFNKSNILNQDFYIINFLEELKDYNIDFQFTFFKTNCGFLQFFTHKWNKAAMASSVEIRSPFLDKNVYLFLQSLPLDQKIKGGDLKSILKKSYEDILPEYILNQNFKQGLPVDKKKIYENDIKNIILDVFEDNDFNNMSWNIKKIKDDFKNNNNVGKIWDLVKYHLLYKGLKKRYKESDIINLELNTVPKLEFSL